MSNSRAVRLAYFSLLLVMLFWAGNAIVARAVRMDVMPFTLAFARWTGAIILLAPFVWRHLRIDRATLCANAGPILLLGVIGVAGFNALLYSGLQYTSATNGLLLQALIPGLVLLFDLIFFRVVPRWLQILGLAATTLGVALVVLHGDLAQLATFRLGLGEILILIAVAAWALYTSLLRLRPAIHPLSFLFVTFVIAMLCMAPLAIREWQSYGLPPLRADIFAALAYVAIFPSLLAYLLFNNAVEKLGPAMAGLSISLMPLFGAFLAAALLGEPLRAYHFIGMALILTGIVLSIPRQQALSRAP